MERYTIKDLDKYNDEELKNIKVLFNEDITEINERMFLCENLQYMAIFVTREFVRKHLDKFAKFKYLNYISMKDNEDWETYTGWITIPNIIQFDNSVLILHLTNCRCDEIKNTSSYHTCYCKLFGNNYNKIKNMNIIDLYPTKNNLLDNLPNNLEFLKLGNCHPLTFNNLFNLPITLKNLILVCNYGRKPSNIEIDKFLKKIKLPYGCELIIITCSADSPYKPDSSYKSDILYKSS